MASNVAIRFFDSSSSPKPYQSGECTIQNYQDAAAGWIEVSDCAFTIESESSWDRGTGSAGSPPVLSEFSFTHSYDRSAPVLMRNFATGTPFSKVQIRFFKPTGHGSRSASASTSPFDVYCELFGVETFITKVTNKSDEDGKVEQEVEMKAKALSLQYRTQGPDGSMGTGIPFSHDFIRRQKEVHGLSFFQP